MSTERVLEGDHGLLLWNKAMLQARNLQARNRAMLQANNRLLTGNAAAMASSHAPRLQIASKLGVS